MKIKKRHISVSLSKLPDLDSNQDSQNQNLMYYPYTIGHPTLSGMQK